MRFFELHREDEGTFTVTLNESHPIFQAHFPNYPILPGACTEEIIRKAAENALGKPARVTQVKQLKFIQVIALPEDKKFQVSLTLTPKEADLTLIKAILKNETKIFCKAELIVKATNNV